MVSALGTGVAGGSRTTKMRTGAPKQKWTPEEEAALRAGVDKYGAGKWRAIQRDPRFGPALLNRSNVDLKDKWRNLSVSNQVRQGGMPRSKARRIKTSERSYKNMTDSSESEVEDEMELDDDEDEDEDGFKNKLGPRYDDLVADAIVSMKEPNGSDITTIAKYIEEHQRVPSRFRKLLTLKLKALTAQGKLIKVGKTFNVVKTPTPTYKAHRLRMMHNPNVNTFMRTPAVYDMSNTRPTMKSEEAIRLAAQAIADAEAAALVAEQAAREAEAAEITAEALAEAYALQSAQLGASSEQRTPVGV